MLYSTDIDKHQNCPQCGDTLEIHFKYSKIIKCSSCSSSIFLEDDQTRLIGESSVLSPEPSVIRLHNAFDYQNKTYMPLGKIRYSYGRGFWEEWFLKSESNKEYWLSIDEGDFVLEEKIELPLPIKASKDLHLGKRYGQYVVTQKGEGRCIGFEGELPKTIQIGEVHDYIHLSQGGGKLVTLEFTQNTIETFKGQWIDPLEIKVQH
jgi:ribosomal protein S27AE